MLSKRKLLQLVQEQEREWLERSAHAHHLRLAPPRLFARSIRTFCKRIGVSKTNGTTELQLLEYYVREDLNQRAPRVMAVLDPLKVIIDNYPDDQVE